MTNEEKALLLQATQDLRKLEQSGRRIDLWLDVPTTVTLIAQLQLALRNPTNRGPSALAARDLLQKLWERVAETPAVRKILAMGDDPRYELQLHQAGAEASVRAVRVAIVGPPWKVDVMPEVAAREELAGRLVLRTAVYLNPGAQPGRDEIEDRLDGLAGERIALADEVLILDVPGMPSALLERYRCLAIERGKRLRHWSEDYGQWGDERGPAGEPREGVARDDKP